MIIFNMHIKAWKAEKGLIMYQQQKRTESFTSASLNISESEFQNSSKF